MIHKEQFNIGMGGLQGGGGNPFAGHYIVSLQPLPILNASLASVFLQVLYNIDRKEGDFMLCMILLGFVTVLVTAKMGIPLVLCLKDLNKKTG